MKKVFRKWWCAVKRKFYQEVTRSEGFTIATEDENLTAGSVVFKIDEEGLPAELPNGKYTTQAGVELEVFEGVLTEYDNEVKAVEDAVEETEMEVVELNQRKVKFYTAYLKRKYYNTYG